MATAIAAAAHRLHVQFEVDAAPQEHLSMVTAGIGCSIVPKSALYQSGRMLDNVQQWSIDGFDLISPSGSSGTSAASLSG